MLVKLGVSGSLVTSVGFVCLLGLLGVLVTLILLGLLVLLEVPAILAVSGFLAGLFVFDVGFR